MEASGSTTIFPLLLLSFTLLTDHSSSSASLAPAASPADFIRTSCEATSYPDVCVRSLASYAAAVRNSPRQLAHVATTVSANLSHDTSSYLSGLSAAAAAPAPPAGRAESVRGGSGGTGSVPSDYDDCTVAMADSTRQLRKSVQEMARLDQGPGTGTRGFARRTANVRTWISAALTDQNACLGSLQKEGAAAGGEEAAVVREKVVEVSRVTSNALSLVNLVVNR